MPTKIQQIKAAVLGYLGVGMSAASQLPRVETPKVPRTQQAQPSYLRSATPGDAKLPRRDLRTATTDYSTFRTGTSTRQVVRDFAQVNPDMSAAVYAYLRTAITSNYIAVAKNMDGTFNPEATNLLQQLLTRFDVVKDYKDGFSGINSIRSTSESMGKDLLYYGACSMELVLGKDRLPRALVPLSASQIDFKSDGTILKPVQVVPGGDRDLDYPTFFYVALDQDLLEPHAQSPLEAAIQPVQFSTDFMNDLRRVVHKAIHPRLTVTIDEDRLKKNIPATAQQTQEQYQAYMNNLIETIKTNIDGLEPQDALVMFDMLKAEYMTGGNTSLDAEYKVLIQLINSKLATGAKTMPAILGHEAGSQNIASTQTMLFLKNAEGAVQAKLNEIYSQALTLALRLFGLDVYVEFRYDSIDLRPDAELEAFRSMKQDRVLELLSLGLITDEEASLTLTRKLPPKGAPKLSGTGFHKKSSAGGQNPYSNTSTGGNGGALNQSVTPDTPKNKKGS